MSSNFLRQLSSFDNLKNSWDELWPNIKRQKSSGVDGATPKDFQKSLDSNLRDLSSSLRAGAFEFQPLRGCPVLKKDGVSHRLICIPTVRDRLVQRTLSKLLVSKAERLGLINEASYGFSKGIGGITRGLYEARNKAIELRAKHKWVYKSDISAFFDNIPRVILQDMVVKTLGIRSLSNLIKLAINCEIDPSDAAVNRIAKENGIAMGRGVRQGMPLSPLFANVVLRNFDRELLKRGAHLVRYADDFIIFADSEEECLEYDALARKLLKPLGLTILELGAPKTKTVIAAPDDDVEFLGLALSKTTSGYQLLITQKQFDKMKQVLGSYRDVDFLCKQGLAIHSVSRAIENKVSGYRAAYDCASNKDELREILDKSSKEILARIYSGIFGHGAVLKLTKKQSRFLGISD